jgi:hypothetical protein
MAQSIQIVPKYSFPYVETVINDYTLVADVDPNGVSEDSTVRYIFPFVSSKGIDNKFIRKRGRANIVSAYGETNWKKYGQPLMQALHVSEAANAEVWCMRVMPSDAAYAHNIISAYYKADTATDVATASNRKFRIKYVQKTAAEAVTSTANLLALAAELDGAATDGVYTDGEGYTQIPGIITLYCAGRGKYGNNYRLRISQDIYYEKDYGIKHYDFEVISSESGLSKEATYVGTVVTSSKYNEATLINDILTDTDEGVVPVYINVDENGIEDLYNAYVEWVTALIPDLEAELAATDTTDTETVAKLTALIEEASNIPDIDEFDYIFGRNVASTTTNSFVEFPVALTADISLSEGTTEEDYIANAAYTSSNIVAWDSVTGAKLSMGSDGSFETAPEGSTVDSVIEECYKKAFSGVYDKRILTAKRIKAQALWDANYPMSVKATMADLALLRNDAICYLDCGIMNSFSDHELKTLIMDYSVFDDYKISKNVHHYYIKESTTKKRIPVTITYFLARQYADHLLNYGYHIPFVKSYAQLTGHVKDSLAPSLEDFEVDLKETLTENRFNFFETIDDNVYQRATQNTSQMTTSDLLEENNVATLYEMKRIIEADIIDRLYDFSDAETRQRFRTYELAKFADWSGKEVESFDIDFRMSDWEAERSILHAYLDVTFRGLQKRAILEIDINKRSNSDTAAEA